MSARNKQEHIAAEAADWLLRLEEEGPPCHADFVAWLKRSPGHIDEFLMMETTYRTVHQFDPRGRIDLEALLRTASAEIVPLKQEQDAPAGAAAGDGRLPAKQRIRRPVWSFAAAVAVIVAGGLFLWNSSRSHTYATAVGEQRAFKLADGSLLHLNTRSRAEVRFSSNAREIRLTEGEALFTVRPDAARPFRVLTGSAMVQAVGTAFNVYRRSDESTLISVVEGKVKVSAPAGNDERARASPHGTGESSTAPPPAETPLAAGEEVNVLGDGKIVRRATPDVAQTLSWRQRRLVFRETTLGEVVAQFNRYNADVQLQVDNPRMTQRHITGTFDADEPQAFVKFLEEDPAVALERRANRVMIRSRAASEEAR